MTLHLKPETAQMTKYYDSYLDRLRESANDSARNFRVVYTFYLVIALYILVIVSSTDHETLFKASTYVGT